MDACRAQNNTKAATKAEVATAPKRGDRASESQGKKPGRERREPLIGLDRRRVIRLMMR
ncbi:MAG: hypothetical protein ABIV42_01290 [Nitrosospira sp.]